MFSNNFRASHSFDADPLNDGNDDTSTMFDNVLPNSVILDDSHPSYRSISDS